MGSRRDLPRIRRSGPRSARPVLASRRDRLADRPSSCCRHRRSGPCSQQRPPSASGLPEFPHWMIEVAVHGARLLVHDDARLDLASILASRLPRDIVRRTDDETGPVRYDVSRDAAFRHYHVTRGGEAVDHSDTAADVIDRLCARIELDLATLARGYIFIHAGVVGWRGAAILIPGMTGSGKSTLVGELVRHGAEYYSDEWAVLDATGRVHPFARPIRLRADAPISPVVTARPVALS